MANKLQKKENNQLIIESEVESKLNILVKGQANNSKQLIEFVKQTIGHRRLDTTSAYVNKLSDQERRARINAL